MQAEELYWTVVAAVFAALWTIAMFVRDRNASAIQQSNALMNRILEIDRFLMEHPEIQRYMAATATKPEGYFCSPEVLDDDNFYKAKSLAYFHVNLFDELLSFTKHAQRGMKALMPPGIIELPDWQAYIKRKFSHPLYRSILNNESEILGASLRDHWLKVKESISPGAPSPYVW